jgi:hypothetical protein
MKCYSHVNSLLVHWSINVADRPFAGLPPASGDANNALNPAEAARDARAAATE